jgi:hypothetical protein
MVALARRGVREIIMAKLTVAAGAALLAVFLASFGPARGPQYSSGASLAAVSPYEMTVAARDLAVAPTPDAF